MVPVVIRFWGIKNQEPPAATEAAISRVRTLLEAVDYTVISHPRTGNAEADSIVASLDFLALRPDRSLAGRIRTAAADADSEADSDLAFEAARLEPAVWVLEDQLKSQRSVELSLEPVLILVGGHAPPFEKEPSLGRKPFHVITTPSESELAKIIASEDKASLKNVAAELFGARPAQPAAPTPATLA